MFLNSPGEPQIIPEWSKYVIPLPQPLQVLRLQMCGYLVQQLPLICMVLNKEDLEMNSLFDNSH